MKMKDVADDVWFEIYLRLPLDSIFRFKSVSKAWLSNLSSPNFMNRWYKLNYLSLPWGLVHYATSTKSSYSKDKLRRRFSIACPELHSQFMENHEIGFSFSFLDPVLTNLNDKQRKDLFLLGSSNGLVLCRPVFDGKQMGYCVCNPLTGKWVSVPPPPPREKDISVTGFICNECFSESAASYKVIRIPKFEAAAKEFEIEVFCSDLGAWSVYDVSSSQDVTWDGFFLDNYVTHNGVYYWFQKENTKILAVTFDGNKKECRLINLPAQAMDGDLELHHRLGESEGSICYAILNGREKILSVWVLKEEDWCLLYKDNQFHYMLAEMETLLIGGGGMDDFITEIEVLGFSPVDQNVVILGYDNYIWAYNTRTKGCEQLSHPSYLHCDGLVSRPCVLSFCLKPMPSVLPPVSLRNTCISDGQHENKSECVCCHIS